MTLRVLVADDQEIVRTGLAMILGAQDGIEVVATAVDGQDAVEQARDLRPDVCLFDIRMPRLNGIEATRALAGPDVADPMAVVVVTTFDLDEYVYGALLAGARGFLLKDCGPELLTQAVRAAADGEVADRADGHHPSAEEVRGQGHAAPADLTADRARGAGAGRGGPRADQPRGRRRALHLAQHGEDAPRLSLMGKLGVRNRVELALWAYQTRRLD